MVQANSSEHAVCPSTVTRGPQKVCGGDALGQLRVDVERLARSHHPAEFDVIESAHHRDLRVLGRVVDGDQKRTRLQGRLADEHAGKHGEPRIVPREHVKLRIQVFARADRRLSNLDDFVEPQERRRCGISRSISSRFTARLSNSRGRGCQQLVDIVGDDHPVIHRPQPAGHDDSHGTGVEQAGDLLGICC